MTAPPGLDRLSLNQATTERWSLEEAVAGCVRHGILWIAPWRHKLSDDGAVLSARQIRDAGLRVSSLCRGGFFPAATAQDRLRRIDDNKRAVEEAGTLGTEVLVLVCGPAPDRDIAAARGMVMDGIAATVDHAAACGVRLAIEPLHPMFAADRSVVVTLGQALSMAEQFDSDRVGVIVDAYHVWWDPDIDALLERAGPRMLGFHVSDWIAPPPDHLFGRVMMGDGVIELRRMRCAVDAAGYRGPIEVEVLNRTLQESPGDDVLRLMRQRYLEHV